MKRFFAGLCGVIVLFAALYILPRDSRIPLSRLNVRPWDTRLKTWYDFTAQLRRASVSLPGRQELLSQLAFYPFKETDSFLHGGAFIYRSTDRGRTWQPTPCSMNCADLDVSDSGKIIIANGYRGAVMLSTDHGATWHDAGLGIKEWAGCSLSGDGSVMVTQDMRGSVYISTDTGVSWRDASMSFGAWSGVAVSGDGRTILMANAQSQPLWISRDRGVTFSTCAAVVPSWINGGSSYDGRILVGLGNVASFPKDNVEGHIYVSTDAGATWNRRGPSDWFYSVAVSSDGAGMLAVGGNSPDTGRIYRSRDSGETWRQEGTTNMRYVIDISDDGSAETTSIYNVGGGRIEINEAAAKKGAAPARWKAVGKSLKWNGGGLSADGTVQFMGQSMMEGSEDAMHVSLGRDPLQTVHRDCILAPESMTYPAMALPAHAVLTFDCGIISSINDQLTVPVTFKVVLKDNHGKEQAVFEKTVEPLNPDYYTRTEDRESGWESYSVDLSTYSGRQVTFTFMASAGGNTAVPAFWGQPQILAPATGPAKKNVLLLLIGSLRADHLSAAACPTLERWSRDGVVFDHALSNANTTKLSVNSMLASRYPFEMPEVARQYRLMPSDREYFYARRCPTLPGVLKKEGYRTAQIGAVSLFSGGHGASADMGFDESRILEHPGDSPSRVTRAAIDWLEKHGRQPFFMMISYDGLRGSYRPPLKYLLRAVRPGVPLPGWWRDVWYRAKLLHHDAYLERLRSYLASRGLDRDTVIVITADHGAGFRAKGASITPDDVQVPLVIIDPVSPVSAHRSEYVQLLDVAPTIVSMCGAAPPPDFRGKNLAPLMAGSAFDEPVTFHQGWFNYGIYAGHRYLYIRAIAPRDGSPPGTPISEELFDIQRDPRCLADLAAKEPALLGAMRRRAQSFVRPARRIRLGFSGKPGQRAQLSLALQDTVRRTLPIDLSSGSSVEFAIGPHCTAVLSGTINGRKITPADVLVGGRAAPLDTGLSFSQDDLDRFAGWPDMPAVPGPRIVVGVIEKDFVPEGRNNAARIFQHLESALEQTASAQ